MLTRYSTVKGSGSSQPRTTLCIPLLYTYSRCVYLLILSGFQGSQSQVLLHIMTTGDRRVTDHSLVYVKQSVCCFSNSQTQGSVLLSEVQPTLCATPNSHGAPLCWCSGDCCAVYEKLSRMHVASTHGSGLFLLFSSTVGADLQQMHFERPKNLFLLNQLKIISWQSTINNGMYFAQELYIYMYIYILHLL